MSNFTVDLSGRVALVTGAGSGHGRVIAMALAAAGASVAVSDINIERAEAIADEIALAGGAALALHADVSNRFQAASIIERTRDAYARVDILVNGAEVYHPEALLGIDEWHWRRQLEVNSSGAFFCLQLAARVMADEGGGAIINLALEPEHAKPPAHLPIGYLAGKASLLAMTRQAARELADRDIRVNAIASKRIVEASGIKAERLQNAEDIGSLALFLCSDAARALNGQVLVANA